MKRVFLVLLAMLVVVCWAPAAFAVCSFDLNTINDPAVGPGPYVHVEVDLTSPTTATILATAYDGFKMGDGSSFGVNFNGPVTISGLTFYDPKTDINPVTPGLPPGQPPGPNPPVTHDGYLALSPQNVDGWGTFTTVFDVASNGPADNFDVITFVATLGSGTWASCSDVLLNDIAKGVYPAEAHVQNQLTDKTGFATVPIPPSVLLMGSGLLGLGLLGYRRKRS